MTKKSETTTLNEIVKALENAGYDPLAQLHGYLETGSSHFITRKENAREKIKTLDLETIRAFLYSMEHQRD